MKDYLQIMKEEQTQLRKMIADCLRFFKKQDGYWIERSEVNVHRENVYLYSTGLSLQDLLEYINPTEYSSTFIKVDSVFNDTDEAHCSIYCIRKQTDQEYFESICSYILPTEHQWKQYQDYLRLKKQFESE